MRYALIGCGRIGSRHLAAARGNKLETVALCDRVTDRAAAFSNGGAFVCDNIREALKARPDLVAIATDSGSHAALAREALMSGANVIIEKPMAMCLSDADSLIELAAKKNLTLAVCHQNRFNPTVVPLLSALSNGRLGALIHGAAQVRWYRDESYYKQAPWRGKWSTDGGSMMNQSIHCIDLLCAALGRPESVSCFYKNALHPYNEAEDIAVAALTFSSGALGIIESTTCAVPQNLSETLSVFGSRGSAVIGGVCLDKVLSWRVPDTPEPTELETPPDIYGFGHFSLYSDVIDAIKRNRRPVVSGEEGRLALSTVLSCYESAALGKTIRVK